ncbi:MAG: CHASE2 domain-containing protein [Dehalococcoidales bacterium]|nr:CHASE2 domain-containing protein [Dehalococcoidales bacterium]
MTVSIKNPHIQSLLLIIAGLLVILFLVTVKPFSSMDRQLTDLLFLDDEPSREIVIVGIDDETLVTHGAWSNWSRSLHAQAVTNLKEAGSLVIGLDILFSDVSSEDEKFAEAINHAGNVILPLVGAETLPAMNNIITYNQVIPPIPILEKASHGTGHANIKPDPDGTVRNIPLLISDSSGLRYHSFSLSVLESMFATPLPVEITRQNGKLPLFSREIPVDSQYNFRIDFSTDNEKRPCISYADVISGNFDPSLVEDKVVLVGMTATGEHDKWIIPNTGEKIPGVYIHAIVIDNILNQRFITEMSPVLSLFFLIIISFILGLALPHLSLKSGSIFTFILLVVTLVICFISFDNGYLTGILYPAILHPVCLVGNIIIRNTSTLIENTGLKKELEDGYTGTIRALAASIEAKDHYTRGHSQRVTEYALMTAAALGFSAKDMKTLEYASILHDIGKIGIPDTILTKPAALDDDERALVQRHTSVGADIIDEVLFLTEAKKLVLYHHERYDGTGYPEGISASSIPLGARIIAVVDSFDSMTSDRAYRLAMSDDKAIDEIKRCIGTQFCPVAAEAFLEAYRKHQYSVSSE